MTSIRHNPGESAGDDAYLDAARASILAVGWRRTTLTDVAKRAGVSRMTLYRRWPDMPGLLGDLMLREWGAVVAAELPDGDGTGPRGPRAIAESVARCVSAIRQDALFRKIVEVDPDLLLPYLVERRGRTQDLVLDALTDVLRRAQSTDPTGTPPGSSPASSVVRAGDPLTLATGVLLTLHGFLFSAPTMTGPGRTDLAALDAELVHLIERYLAP